MMQRSVIEQAIADFGSICMIGLARDGSDAKAVRMVIRPGGEGAINPRSSLRRFVDVSAQRPGAISLSGNARADASADASGAVSASLPRLSSGSSLTSPADILAHARDYGGQCRRYARQAAGWQDTHDAWKRTRR